MKKQITNIRTLLVTSLKGSYKIIAVLFSLTFLVALSVVIYSQVATGANKSQGAVPVLEKLDGITHGPALGDVTSK